MKMHITDSESIHNFFSYVSKVVLIIPIFVVVVSLFFKFNQPKTSTNLSNDLYKGQSIAQNNSIKFDLKGPIVCDNLFIQNKNIYFKNKSINYLLNGDCLYIWEVGKSDGQKKCGLSNYISMAENYLGSLNIDDLVTNNLVREAIKGKDIDLAKVVNSCKKEEINDKNIFDIPKKIIFKP